MALFEYKGVTAQGKSTRGVIDADSSKTARARLKSKGIFTTEIHEKATGARPAAGGPAGAVSFGRGGVKLRNLTMMVRQLATLIKARIPLDEALAALIEQTDDNKLKAVLSKVRESVNEGKPLADACRMFPKVFSPIFVAMIQVGEASGNLDVVLNRLAAFTENQYELRNKVVGAMAYPAFIMVAGMGITIFLFAFAIPKITEVFAGSNQELPLLTEIMIGISKFMSHNWFSIVFGVVSLFFFLQWYRSTKTGKARWDRFILKVPGFGKMNRMIVVSRFARTMSTMIASGVQLLEAIDIVKDVVDNTVIRGALAKSRESISEGHTIAAPLRASGEFPPMLTHMIAVGEKTGELEEMLTVVSDSYDEQVENAINSMTRLLEPLMILVMGGVILLVALSIFLPMLQLNNLSAAPG